MSLLLWRRHLPEKPMRNAAAEEDEELETVICLWILSECWCTDCWLLNIFFRSGIRWHLSCCSVLFFWLRIYYECPVCLSVRAAAIWGSMARGCVSSTLPQLLADSYLLHVSFSKALKLDNWLPQGEWSETERGQERSHRVLDMISSDKPFRRSCRPTLVHCERGLHQSGLKTQEAGIPESYSEGWLSQLWLENSLSIYSSVVDTFCLSLTRAT